MEKTVIEPSPSLGFILTAIFSIVIILVFLLSTAMIIGGFMGVIVSLVRKTPRKRWIGFVKWGFIILIVELIFLVAINVMVNALGVGQLGPLSIPSS
jgi:hypothetical protein